MTIAQPGGLVGGRLFTVGGSSVLSPTGRYILFLKWFATPDKTGLYGVVGGGQGSYGISVTNDVSEIPGSGIDSGVMGMIDGRPIDTVIDQVQLVE